MAGLELSCGYSHDPNIRRSGNFQPTLWDYHFIQSITSHYSMLEPSYIGRVKELKQEVKTMLGEVAEPLEQLKLIDDLERLGLSYHFLHEIDTILITMYNKFDHAHHHYWEQKGLYASALAFRIFRQHAHNIPQDIFASFMDESSGEFKEWVGDDTKAMLCLYEASYLSVEGEMVVERARDFATKHIQEHVKKQNYQDQESIAHALELPLHWGMPRSESRWFIDIYEKRHDMNHTLLELAKLDFNMVQATHQQDLKHTSRWWRSTCLAKKLSFSRDRLVECFLWAVGMVYEPQFEYARTMLTRVGMLITAIDDVYDVYGSLNELKLFTNVVQRWDLEAMEQLPKYMKICFFVLYNTVNEMAFDAMKNHDINIISHLKNSWAELCKTYLVEAEWYYSGYTPSLQEYLDNAWISFSAPLVLFHAYLFVADPVTSEGLACFEPGRYCDIIRWSATITRLANDMGTSSGEMQKGDVPKSIQCYMHESGVSEVEARGHIRQLIDQTWKKINKETATNNNPLCGDFVRIALNFARMAGWIYQFGDGHTSQGQVTQDRISAIIIQPVT